jgi:hypothetical protein
MAYHLTEKRLESARANLQKAWQAHRAKRALRPERPPNLKHGFFACDLRRSVILLGEDVSEYDAHVERFEHSLAPVTERERQIVAWLAEAAWRLIRGYRARANAQSRKLRKLLDSFVEQAPLNPRDTKALAFLLVEMFNDEPYLLACVTRLRDQFEWLLGRLFIERTGSDQGFRLESAAKSTKWNQMAGFDEGLGVGGEVLGTGDFRF